MDRAQHIMGNAALVLGLILVAVSVCFASDQIASDLCDLGLTIGFMKTVE